MNEYKLYKCKICGDPYIGDAAPINCENDVPASLERFVLGPHAPRLRAFKAAHPEIRVTTGHMWLNFFEDVQ